MRAWPSHRAYGAIVRALLDRLDEIEAVEQKTQRGRFMQDRIVYSTRRGWPLPASAEACAQIDAMAAVVAAEGDHDFTSRPSRRKPITVLHCTLTDSVLRPFEAEAWSNFQDFEAALTCPGPWIAGIDFRFGQARRFIEMIG